MIASCAEMNKINNELVRTQNELALLEDFASFAVHRDHREKWRSSAIPVTTYEKAAASRFRTRMTQIARIFADIVDSFASLFHSTDNKPQRSQSTQSKIEKLWAVGVLDDGLTLFTSWLTRIYTYPHTSASSAQSAFHRRLSAFICVHPRLISVSFSNRAQKKRGDL